MKILSKTKIFSLCDTLLAWKYYLNLLRKWIIYYFILQNQLIGKGKDRIFDAGARIKRALSPGRHADLDDYDPYGSPTRSPKVPRLSFDPEISDDEEDEQGKEIREAVSSTV